jgi:predicted phosphodiesterase
MRILVISDIHANLTALEAVLASAEPFDSAWCLGDLVGYGPDPNECIRRVRELPELVCLMGNHDAAVVGKIDVDSFNLEARLVVRWTRTVLTDENETYLRELPDRRVVDSVTLAHGSPRHPVWEYLLDTRTATQNFSYFDTPYCFVGHSHLPVIFQLNKERRAADLFVPESEVSLELSPRAILNPGSVGQPRDRDPRAAYAIFDPEALTWTHHRVAYEIPTVQARMETAGLPDRHIIRLSAGW